MVDDIDAILSLGTKRAISGTRSACPRWACSAFPDAAGNGARIWGGEEPPPSDDKAYKGG